MKLSSGDGQEQEGLICLKLLPHLDLESQPPNNLAASAPNFDEERIRCRSYTQLLRRRQVIHCTHQRKIGLRASFRHDSKKLSHLGSFGLLQICRKLLYSMFGATELLVLTMAFPSSCI